jgi:RNA polymerase sigma-70 factor (ECF subfamily)
MQSKTTDTALIIQYKNTGNIDIAGVLYEPYMPLVYGVCLKYLKNREAAQDAVIDIFEKLIVELQKHNTPDNFKTWLYVVAKNFCLMKIRSDKSKENAAANFSDFFMNNQPELHPIDRDDNEDLLPLLKKCIGKLKDLQRESVELFYFKELSYKEISEKLNLDEKKVKSHIQNGKRNLKICIENSKT